MAVQILKPSLLTTVQDLGRTGQRHLGVPLSGAADPVAHRLANFLVGKPASAASIEFTLTGALLRFTRAMRFAVIGADTNLILDGKRLDNDRSHLAEAGAVLELGAARAGCRSYLALSADLAVPRWLGSASVYPAAGFGQALQAGDELTCKPGALPEPRTLDPEALPARRPHWVLRALPGPEFASLTPAAGDSVFTQAFTVGTRADRMGIELTGPELTSNEDGRLASSAVFPGTVQCPPSGKPFLLLPDAQTTGGYPRIAQVIAADRHLLGQIRPADSVRFWRTDTKQAQAVLHAKRTWLDQLTAHQPGR